MTINIDLVRKAIDEELNKIVEEEIVIATENINKRIRGKIGFITSNIASRFSYEDFGQSIKISIDTMGLPKT